MRDKKIFRVIATAIALLALLAVLYLLNPQKELQSIKDVKVIKEIKDYGYELSDNQTPLYKELFNELKDILTADEVNYEKYAVTIAKMFVADFYDLNSKISKNNVGGLDFVHEDIKTNFITNAQNTLYNHLENNIYGNRDQELPKVKNIELVEVTNSVYIYNDVTDNNAYNINLKWIYVKDLGYQTEAVMTIVKEENKLYIVELK